MELGELLELGHLRVFGGGRRLLGLHGGLLCGHLALVRHLLLVVLLGVLLLLVVLVLGMALGVTCRDLILAVVGSLVGALAAVGERR